MLQWFGSEDGKKGENRPVPILASMLGIEIGDDSEYQEFDSGDEFMRAWTTQNGG